MSITEPEPKETQLIPDFFYEFISRIIPGLVVIALSFYWSDSDFKAISSSLGLSLFVLVAAWIIGTTLDVGVFMVVKWICPGLLKKIPASHRDIWEYLCKAKSWERESYNKAEALRIFFRNIIDLRAHGVPHFYGHNLLFNIGFYVACSAQALACFAQTPLGLWYFGGYFFCLCVLLVGTVQWT